MRLQRGIVLAMRENFEGARAEFEKAVMLAPDASVPYVALALMLLQMDRPTTLSPCFESEWRRAATICRYGSSAKR